MHLINLKDCTEFMAGDATILREILHPDKAYLKLRYSLAHATVKPGIASKPHKLKTSEVYYILEGEGLMFIDNESKPVSKDSTVYIPPHAIQHIENTGKVDLKFICIVDPAWRVEDEEIM
jgi:mannose-6-phosphate isomerase-like protein (cupin superfamily)